MFIFLHYTRYFNKTHIKKAFPIFLGNAFWFEVIVKNYLIASSSDTPISYR